MHLPARAGPPATAAPALSATRRQRRKVDKCRVADKKRTNQQTNTHYSFIGIDIYIQLVTCFLLPCIHYCACHVDERAHSTINDSYGKFTPPDWRGESCDSLLEPVMYTVITVFIVLCAR